MGSISRAAYQVVAQCITLFSTFFGLFEILRKLLSSFIFFICSRLALSRPNVLLFLILFNRLYKVKNTFLFEEHIDNFKQVFLSILLSDYSSNFMQTLTNCYLYFFVRALNELLVYFIQFRPSCSTKGVNYCREIICAIVNYFILFSNRINIALSHSTEFSQ